VDAGASCIDKAMRDAMRDACLQRRISGCPGSRDQLACPFDQAVGSHRPAAMNAVSSTSLGEWSDSWPTVRPLLSPLDMKLACLALLAAGSLPACVEPGGLTTYPAPNEPTPLAKIDAWVSFAPDRNLLYIDSGVLGCPRVDAGLRVTADGAEARMIDAGGSTTVDTTEPGHKVTNCAVPTFQLPTSTGTQPVSTVIADDSATWTLTFDHPNVPRVLSIVAPAAVYRPGDTITVQMDLPGRFGGGVGPRLTARKDGKDVFSVYSNSEYGAPVQQFTVPAVDEIVDATDVELSIISGIEPHAIACEGPSRCYPILVSGRLHATVTLAP